MQYFEKNPMTSNGTFADELEEILITRTFYNIKK